MLPDLNFRIRSCRLDVFRLFLYVRIKHRPFTVNTGIKSWAKKCSGPDPMIAVPVSALRLRVRYLELVVLTVIL